MPPNTLDLSRLSPKSLKDLLLSEYKKLDVQRAVLAELGERNDAALRVREEASAPRDYDGPVI